MVNYECRYYDPESRGGPNSVMDGGEYNAAINPMRRIANEARVVAKFVISFEGYVRSAKRWPVHKIMLLKKKSCVSLHE